MKISTKIILCSKVVAVVFLFSAVFGCQKSLLTNIKKNDTIVTLPPENYGQTTTLAGSGSNSTPLLNNPNGVVADAQGNIYVTAQGANAIKKIDPNGVVTIFAGSGAQGAADGNGIYATFNNPIGITIDASNNLYVTDFGNNLIRKISAVGVVSTLAGSGAIGFNDGSPTMATFNGPTGIVIDSKDNLFVADNHNLIREISPAGMVSTFAGNVHNGPGFADGTGPAANFALPEGLAIDAQDNIYVADLSNNMIRKITPQAVVTTIAGSQTPGYADGPAASATFETPLGVSVDASGNIFVTDNGNNVVRKISAAGVVTTLAGNGQRGFANGPNLQASFNDLHGITIDALGNIYVGDEQNDMVRKIAPEKAVN